MTTLSSININDNLKQLIRYVKPSHIENGQAKEDTFQLREDRKPPEEYVSFFHSRHESVENIIRDVKILLEQRKIAIKQSGAFLFLNAFLASEEINITREIVEFKECGYPHYGMYYLSDNDIDRIEAKTVLLHHSELYMLSSFQQIDNETV